MLWRIEHQAHLSDGKMNDAIICNDRVLMKMQRNAMILQ